MEKLKKQFEKLTTDEQRWQWLLDNKNPEITIYLDNDCTFVEFGEIEDAVYFDGYVGWQHCVVSLLHTIGLNAQPV